jgi:Peptidase A4 family
VSKLELARGLTVRTFPLPPTDFSPIKATSKDLLRYGFPSRPEQPELLERWERILSRPIHPIQPVFRAMDYKRHHLRGESGPTHGVESSNVWSGAVVYAPAGTTMKWVEGTWTVPDAFPPRGFADGVWYSASTWVGIDGDGSGDVIQAGCDSDVLSSGGNLQRQLNPWWEWYPGGSFWISNLPIRQGDTVNCLICVTSATEASIFLYNVTSGVAASFVATPPAGTSAVGNSAEWVVEALAIDTAGPELARYGDVYFDECNASTSANVLRRPDQGNTINMTDSTGAVISRGTIETPTLVQVRYTGA